MEETGKSLIERHQAWEPIEPLTVPKVSMRRLLIPLGLAVKEGKTDVARESAALQLGRFRDRLEDYAKGDWNEIEIERMVEDLEEEANTANNRKRADELRSDYHYARLVRDKIKGRREEMTGLFNRKGILEALWEFMQNPERFIRKGEENVVGKKICLMLADIDHFKRVNDEHGLDVGDEVITEFGEVLLENSRGTDMISRWGGEEFLSVFFGATQGETHIFDAKVALAAEKLSVKGKDGEAVKVNFSTGAVVFEWDVVYKALEEYFQGNSQLWEDEIVKPLSSRLAKAKSLGRGRYVGGGTGTLPPISEQEGKN